MNTPLTMLLPFAKRIAAMTAFAALAGTGFVQTANAQVQDLDRSYNFATPRSQSFTLPVPASAGGGFAMVTGNGGNAISPLNLYDDSTWFVRLNDQGNLMSEVPMTNFLGYGFQVHKMIDNGAGFTVMGTLGTSASTDDRGCLLKIDYSGATVASYISPSLEIGAVGDKMTGGGYGMVLGSDDGSLVFKHLNDNLILVDSARIQSGPSTFDFFYPFATATAPNGGLLVSALFGNGGSLSGGLLRFSETGNLIWQTTVADSIGFPLKMMYQINAGQPEIVMGIQGPKRFARMDTAGTLISSKTGIDAQGVTFTTYDLIPYGSNPKGYVACGFSSTGDPSTLGGWIARMDADGNIDTTTLFQEESTGRLTLLRNVALIPGGFLAGGTKNALIDQATGEYTAGRPWLLTYTNALGFKDLFPSNSSDVAGLSLYPNPINGNNANVTLKLANASNGASPATIRVIDAMGRVAASSAWPAGAQQTTLSTSNLASGVYAVQVGDMVTKLVVE